MPTSSIESAITSRLTSEAFIPSVPMVTPSLMAMVLNSIGVPPAARMPSFTCSASRRRWKLQGMVSVQVLATPMSGRARSSRAEADGLEHRPRRGAVRPLGERAAPVARVRRHQRSSMGISCLALSGTARRSARSTALPASRVVAG